MRARMDVSWEPPTRPAAAQPTGSPVHPSAGAAPLVLAIVALAGIAALGSSSATGEGEQCPRRDVSPEVSFLTRAQNADGGFGGAPGQRSSELYTAWAAMGLAAAGRDPLTRQPRRPLGARLAARRSLDT